MRTATILLVLALTAACTEHPQQLAAARQPGYQSDDWQDQQRARTLRQDESRRIYH